LARSAQLDYNPDSDNTGHDSDGSLSGDEGTVPPKVRAARAALHQKYRQLRHALSEDDMQFAHQNYTIMPSSGEIWANSEVSERNTASQDEDEKNKRATS